MTTVPQLRFSHMGIFVRDLDHMASFYKEVLGFIESDRGNGRDFDVVFLTRDPVTHHQLVLSSGRPENSGPTHGVQQISFRVDALDDLRLMHAVVARRDDVSDIQTVDHGIAWSVYFRDPEENRIEVYLDSPWYVAQPHRVTLDLSLTDAEIRQGTEQRLGSDPTCLPMAEWRRTQTEKLRTANAAK